MTLQNSIIDSIEKSQEKPRPNFHVGDTVTVSVRLKEGDKERVQPFKGVVLAKSPKSGRGPGATFTVRKISDGIGVERIFALHSPFIEKVEVESSAMVRRSRLYYLRSLRGKKARLKETDRFAEMIVPEPIKEESVVEDKETPAEEAPKVEAKAPEKAKAPETKKAEDKKEEKKPEAKKAEDKKDDKKPEDKK